MNEVKAFIRARKAEKVVDGLEEQGFCCMTLLNLMGLGLMADPNKSKFSVNIAERFSKIVKLVVVCDADQTQQVIDIITKHARSGQRGDGIIYVTPVSQSVHIRTGVTGKGFLQTDK